MIPEREVAYGRALRIHIDRIKLEVGALESTIAARNDGERSAPYWSCEYPGGCACGCGHVPGACEYCHFLAARDAITAQSKESHQSVAVNTSKQKADA